MNYPIYTKDIAWQEVSSQVVIIELAGKRLFHQLNDLGSHIWRLCDGKHSIDEIKDSLIATYDADRDVITSDASAFLEDLSNKGLIQWKEH